MEVGKKIRECIFNKLLYFSVDNYNESTYNFSQGYRKCLIDLVEEIDNIVENASE